MFTNRRKFWQFTKCSVMKFFREIITQLRSKSPLYFRYKRDNRNMHETTRSLKGLLQITYSRTVTKSKSLKNALRKGYNWLTSMDLLPSNLTILTDYQTKCYLKTVSLVHQRQSWLEKLEKLVFQMSFAETYLFCHLATQAFFSLPIYSRWKYKRDDQFWN